MDRIKQILFFIIGLLAAIQPAVGQANAPAGAVISNTAIVSYDDGAGGALSLPSDTVHTSVQSTGGGLWLEKTADIKEAVIGDTIAYTVQVHNRGNSTLTHIIVKDTLPEMLSFLSSQPLGIIDDQVITWDIQSLKSGESAVIRLDCEVIKALYTPQIYNWVTGWNKNSRLKSDTSVVIWHPWPDAEIRKTVSPSEVYFGDTLTYTLRVTNTGVMALQTPLVLDSIPTGIRFIDADLPVSISGQSLSWSFDRLEIGQTLQLTYRALVTPDANGDLAAIAALSTVEGVSDTASASVKLLGYGTGIEIIKEAADSIWHAGDTLTYDLILSSGIKPLHTITVKDTLPEYLQYVSSTHQGTAFSNIVTWQLRNLHNGYHDTMRVTTRIRVPIDDRTRVNNEVWAYANTGHQDSSNYEIRVISPPAVRLDLEIDKSVCVIGDTLNFTLTAVNIGTMDLTNVEITDTLQSYMRFVDLGFAKAANDTILRWHLGNLDYRQEKRVWFKAIVLDHAPRDSLKNHAGVTTAEIVSDQDKALTLMLGSGVGIEIIKEAADSIYNAGDTLTYDLILSNGGVRGSPVTIRDTLSEHLAYITSTHNGQLDGNIVIWDLDEFEPGYHDTLRVTTAIHTPIEDKTGIDNIVWARANGALDSSDWHITVNSHPDLRLEILGPEIASPGDTIRYMLIYKNIGTATAFEPLLKDTIPEILEFVDASGNFDYIEPANAVHWHLPSMAPGHMDTLYLYTRIAETATSDDEIINSAWLSYKKASRVAIATCVTQPIPEGERFYTYKQVNQQKASAGDTLLYTIYFGALHQDIEDTVHIIDQLPSQLEWIQSVDLQKQSAELVIFDPVLNRGHFMQIGLRKDITDSIRILVRVRDQLEPGVSWVENRATVYTKEDTMYTADDPRTNSRTQLITPFLEVKKSVNRKVTEVGDVVTYTVTIRNKSGETWLKQLQVYDLLPKGFRYQKGTTVLDSVITDDPIFTPSGKRTLMEWSFEDTLKPLQTRTLKYRVIIGLDVKQGEHKNLVSASGLTPSGLMIVSDQAEAVVLVRKGAFDERGFIFGKVYEDVNKNGLHDNAEPQFKDIELIMEDGTRVKTDEFGKYSIPDVEHGQHVLRVNENTLPTDKEVIADEVRNLKDPQSKLIIVPPGGMTKTNFILKPIE